MLMKIGKGPLMRFLLILMFLAVTPSAHAAPQTYAVVPSQSDVGVVYSFTGKPIQGNFPDYKIDLAIDFKTLKNSTVNVRLQTQSATGGFVFGTQAMRSAKILNAKDFPTITFNSTAITGGGNTAKIKGNVTIRGVTRPLTLDAKLFRPRGRAPNDLSNLIIRLNGTLNRFDFGANGYPDQVGPDLTIKIDANILRK